MFAAQLRKSFIPGADLCVDEQLVGYPGKCSFRQYIHSKPSKYRLKIWWCCDTDKLYPLTADIYLGRQEGQPRYGGQRATVVKELVFPYGKSGRNVVADNFFSSIELDLLVDGLIYVGTIRSNKPT